MPVLNKDNRVNQFGLLFNGNPSRKSKLTPRDAVWIRDDKTYPDSTEPVVCATDDAIISVFMAVTPRWNAPFGYHSNEDGGTNFYVHSSIHEGFNNGTGFVAVVDSKEFELVNLAMPDDWPGQTIKRLPEYRTTQPVIPLFNVAVHYRDFEALLAEQPNSNLLPYP